MFFESKHSFQSDEFIMSGGRNFVFPKHLHRAFELFYQREGESTVTVDEREYRLSAGEAVLSFPYQSHSYSAPQNSRHTMVIFSPELVSGFYRASKGIPKENRFRLSLEEGVDLSNPFLCRALAYRICGEFEQGREYGPCSSSGADLQWNAILRFIHENYCQSCSLRDVAESAGYDYAYVSKLFKRRTGHSFHQYLIRLRIEKSRSLLLESELGVTEIAYECGFGSLRSFHRAFWEAFGVSPSLYREQEREKGNG